MDKGYSIQKLIRHVQHNELLRIVICLKHINEDYFDQLVDQITEYVSDVESLKNFYSLISEHYLSQKNYIKFYEFLINHLEYFKETKLSFDIEKFIEECGFDKYEMMKNHGLIAPNMIRYYNYRKQR